MNYSVIKPIIAAIPSIFCSKSFSISEADQIFDCPYAHCDFGRNYEYASTSLSFQIFFSY